VNTPQREFGPVRSRSRTELEPTLRLNSGTLVQKRTNAGISPVFGVLLSFSAFFESKTASIQTLQFSTLTFHFQLLNGDERVKNRKNMHIVFSGFFGCK
jgi:hypothetical protein